MRRQIAPPQRYRTARMYSVPRKRRGYHLVDTDMDLFDEIELPDWLIGAG